MARNQRQRRPLQDDTRTNKQTVRERAQVSKRQRDRIEENRDRRERRRERERNRRQIVDSVRSPKEDVRIDRFDSRLVPVEDSFLGRPVGAPKDLPVVIGERWDLLGGSQTVNHQTETTVLYDTEIFTTERNGYPRLYQGAATGVFRVPAGLAGIWRVVATVAWGVEDVGLVYLLVDYTDGTDISYVQTGLITGVGLSQQVTAVKNFQEGDEFRVRAYQSSDGGSMTISNVAAASWVFCEFLGK